MTVVTAPGGVQVVTVRVPFPLYEALRDAAREQHTSQTAIIVAAIADRLAADQDDAS